MGPIYTYKQKVMYTCFICLAETCLNSCKEKKSALAFDIFIYRALYRRLPDAGTLLSFDPVSNPKKYKDYDPTFRRVCCGETGGGCDLFLRRRPINTGTDYSEPSMCTDEMKYIVLYSTICMKYA